MKWRLNSTQVMTVWNRHGKLKWILICIETNRKTSQQQSRPGIGGGKPSLAKMLRYAGPLEGFSSVASFAFSTSMMYLFCAMAQRSIDEKNGLS